MKIFLRRHFVATFQVPVPVLHLQNRAHPAKDAPMVVIGFGDPVLQLVDWLQVLSALYH
jgi:hypothetical protein